MDRDQERIRNYELARQAYARALHPPPPAERERAAALRNWVVFALALAVLWWVGPCL